MDWRQIGRRIRRRRRTMDVTQAQLAEKVGVCTSYIGHIERGTRVPSVETLAKVCRALQSSMDHVTAGE